jgi:DNA-binding CsgD family transcriptional regulator
MGLRPHTGRTHQLRAHMQAIGHSILGDPKYGDQISAELSLDPRTVSTYRRRVLNKLGLSTNFELVRYASDHGIVVQTPRADALSTKPGT